MNPLVLLFLMAPSLALAIDPVAATNNASTLAALQAQCDAALRQLVPFKKGSTRIMEPTEILLENTRVHPAVVAVVEAYRAEGRKLPELKNLPTDPTIQSSWKSHWESLPVEVTADVPLTKKIKGGTDPVYDVTIEGKRYVFREINEYQELRLSIAAATANQMIGVGTVPKLRVAKINGKLGALSEFETGAKLPQLNQGAPLRRLIEAGTLNVESYGDAKAFEFLVGNNDAKRADTFIRADGTVVSVDHNYAFTRGLPEYFPNEAALGPVLPETYSQKWKDFVSQVKRGGTSPAKRDAFIKGLSPYLSEAEREAVLFRLEVIAVDMAKK